MLLPVSDYFKSLFLGPFKTNEHIVEVDFSSVALDVESAEAIIEFLYTGVINIDDKNLEAILKLATFLLIQQIQDLCIKYMEQSCILDTYMWYLLLSVDYMVSDAEEIVMKTVKSRFHDYFIFEDSTKALSLFHLNRLVEDYEIFENCMKIDTLSFLVDWVLNGKSDEHETFACKVLDSLRVEKPQRKEYQGSYGNPRIDDGPGNENEKPRSEENVESEDKEPSRNQRRGFNVTVAIEEIKHKLENTTERSKLRQKCKEEIERFFSINAADFKVSGQTIKEATAEHLSKQKAEASVEQVSIAVAPKKHMAEFLQKTESSKSEMEHEWDKATFNVCIYKPRTKTWYYFEENTRNFNGMGRKSSTWPINFCMHNELCCVSPEEKELCMYPLTNNSRGRYWSSTSYKELVRKLPDFNCIKDVSFCCSDGETVYLVAKKKGY